MKIICINCAYVFREKDITVYQKYHEEAKKETKSKHISDCNVETRILKHHNLINPLCLPCFRKKCNEISPIINNNEKLENDIWNVQEKLRKHKKMEHQVVLYFGPNFEYVTEGQTAMRISRELKQELKSLRSQVQKTIY